MVSVINEMMDLVDQSIKVENGTVTIIDKKKIVNNINQLAYVSALESNQKQGWAQYLTRAIALELGIYPASINDLYIARGRGEVPPTFTVPAVNLRMLSFEAARSVFRAAMSMNAGAFIFEIARSEMGYTNQRPNEYTTSILAAAIAEGYQGPVFIQGDHFQVSAKRYLSDPESEINTLKELIKEAIKGGFYNIDVDASTLVDLSKDTLSEQQQNNIELTAMFTDYIRANEPDEITISVGGEIGEVGGQNSTEPELRAFMDGYNQEFLSRSGNQNGLSKISIQTGTSHGGVVLPDGSMAQVDVDFDTLLQLSRIARLEYGLAGAVQHGASTLPEHAFGKFVESEACEVHLATNFMNMWFDHLPTDLRNEMYDYLDKEFASDRKEGMTDEQFYYKTRKNAIGPFKIQSWNVSNDIKDEIRTAWEAQFLKLFRLLGLEGTRDYVDQSIKFVGNEPDIKDFLGNMVDAEDVSDLAD
jgi:fructose/tagatose bisphosphate aldolase